MTFSVRLLGTGAAIPTLLRGTTAQYITCKNRHILIDCGEGTQLKMREFGVKFQDIQIILISHLHGDHILGLPGLLGTMQLLGRTQPLTLIGPKGVQNLLNSLFEFAQLKPTLPIDFIELEPKETRLVFEDRCIEIFSFPLKHRIATHGYRINEKLGNRHLDKEAFDKTGVSVAYISKLIQGEDIIDNNGIEVNYLDVTTPPTPTKSYAFCSDTAFHKPIIEHIKEVDLLYHEATFLEKEKSRAKETFHSTAKQAATIASEANAKRLILGHFSARYKTMDKHLEEAKEVFERVYIPKDGELFWV